MEDRTVKIFTTADNRIAVKFQYNKELINEIKKISGYRWESNEKRWTLPYRKENIFHLLKIFKDNKIEIDSILRAKYLGRQIENKKYLLTTYIDQIISEVKKELILRNYRHGTIKAYKSNLRNFLKYFSPRQPRDLTNDDIKNYLSHLITDEQLTASTVNQVINAVKFLYEEIYKKRIIIDSLPRPKREKRLPDVLNEEEVKRIFESVHNLKHRTMLMLAYASGLRVSELVRLRIEDIDGSRGLIHIRDAKGQKDRYTIFPESLRGQLLRYWRGYKLGTSGWLFPGQEPNQEYSGSF